MAAGKRQFKRGESPFCSPKPGALLESDQGDRRFVYRVLLSEDGEIEGVYYRNEDGTSRCVARQSWSQWCSRHQATVVALDAPLDTFEE